MRDHKQEALKILENCEPQGNIEAIALAQVHATLYLAEQISVSNLRGE
jgi:hypothetical protein